MPSRLMAPHGALRGESPLPDPPRGLPALLACWGYGGISPHLSDPGPKLRALSPGPAGLFRKSVNHERKIPENVRHRN
jgi:hypothetical protein